MIGGCLWHARGGEAGEDARELLLVREVDRNVVQARVPAERPTRRTGMEHDERAAVDAQLDALVGPRQLGEPEQVAPEGERPLCVHDVEMDRPVRDRLGIAGGGRNTVDCGAGAHVEPFLDCC